MKRRRKAITDSGKLHDKKRGASYGVDVAVMFVESDFLRHMWTISVLPVSSSNGLFKLAVQRIKVTAGLANIKCSCRYLTKVPR